MGGRYEAGGAAATGQCTKKMEAHTSSAENGVYTNKYILVEYAAQSVWNIMLCIGQRG